MKFTRHTLILSGRPDAVPIINVVLLLLLFFIIATRFAQDPGVSIELPEIAGANSTAAALQAPLIVTVTARNPETGAHTIYCNDEAVDIKQLGTMLVESGRESPRRECLIKADKNAPHGLVMSILALAQQAGLKTVRVATQAPADSP